MTISPFYSSELTAIILDKHTVDLKVFNYFCRDDKVLATLKFD